MDLRGKPYYWLNFDRAGGEQADDSDIAALRDRAVSVTPLRADRTNDSALELVSGRLRP
jgi:5'-nucleotidase